MQTKQSPPFFFLQFPNLETPASQQYVMNIVGIVDWVGHRIYFLATRTNHPLTGIGPGPDWPESVTGPSRFLFGPSIEITRSANFVPKNTVDTWITGSLPHTLGAFTTWTSTNIGWFYDMISWEPVIGNLGTRKGTCKQSEVELSFLSYATASGPRGQEEAILTSQHSRSITPRVLLSSLLMTESTNEQVFILPMMPDFVRIHAHAYCAMCCVVVQVVDTSTFEPFISLIPWGLLYIMNRVVIIRICKIVVSILASKNRTPVMITHDVPLYDLWHLLGLDSMDRRQEMHMPMDCSPPESWRWAVAMRNLPHHTSHHRHGYHYKMRSYNYEHLLDFHQQLPTVCRERTDQGA